ncbi:MAG: hypothetical protein J6D16_05010 [Clostridia bacterium]|nr:hypothetical protein [Clostridia bacterium]
MIYTVKSEGKKYAYDSASGAVLALNNLQYKMMGAIVPPISPASLTSLRYELAKFDSNDISDAFDAIYELAQAGILYAEDDGVIRLMASGEYACPSETVASALLTKAFEGKSEATFVTVDGDFSATAKKAAEATGTKLS